MKLANLKPALVLIVICIASALVLSSINLITGPIIEKLQSASANAALTEVYPGGKGFEKLDLTKYTLPASVTDAYKEETGGYVIQTTVKGYKPGLVILCGINAEGKIVGAKYIQSNETLDAEVGLGDRFVGKGSDEMTPDIVAGSTAKLTTGAYYNAILDSFAAFAVFGGGSFDNRSPEEILQDNCNEALGTEGVKFTKWIATAVVEGVDAVYEAENNAGRVYVIGDSFIGVKDGAVVGTSEGSDVALAADAVISAITLETVEKPEGTKKNVVKIQKASNGTYVFDLLADGYQAVFDWGDGTQIRITVSIDAEGKILDLVTVSHNESAGLGDACATEEYYAQYLGKGDADVVISSGYPDHNGSDLIPDTSTDVGIIASSTYTTVGYQTAIKAAFEAFGALTAEEGGN